MATQRAGTSTEAGALMALIVGVLVIVLLGNCAGDPAPGQARRTSGPVGARADTASSTGSGAGSGTTAAVGGTLTAGADNVLPRVSATRIGPDGDLSDYAGRTAVGTALPVASVPADEGFWVGYGFDDRVWVELTGGPPESPYDVDSGDLVSFTGRMVANAKGFAARSGVTDAEGRRQLEAQKAHVAVDKGALRLDK